VTIWSPRPRLEVVKEAVPLFKGTCVKVFDPSWKVTMPVGVVDPPVTVAVKETDCPGAAGLGEELKDVVVANAWTFWRSAALPAGKFPSPL
jgi:hypothetical protein